MQVSVWSSECSSREKSVGGPGRRAEEQRGEMRVRELLLNTTTKHWARTRFTSEKTICISLRGSVASSALPIDIDELQLGTSPAHHSLQQRKVRHTHTHTRLCGWQPDSKESHFHVQETRQVSISLNFILNMAPLFEKVVFVDIVASDLLSGCAKCPSVNVSIVADTSSPWCCKCSFIYQIGNMILVRKNIMFHFSEEQLCDKRNPDLSPASQAAEVWRGER